MWTRKKFPNYKGCDVPPCLTGFSAIDISRSLSGVYFKDSSKGKLSSMIGNFMYSTIPKIVKGICTNAVTTTVRLPAIPVTGFWCVSSIAGQRLNFVQYLRYCVLLMIEIRLAPVSSLTP